MAFWDLNEKVLPYFFFSIVTPGAQSPSLNSSRSLILYLVTIWQNLAHYTGVRSFGRAGILWGSVAVLFVINLFLPRTLLLF